MYATKTPREEYSISSKQFDTKQVYALRVTCKHCGADSGPIGLDTTMATDWAYMHRCKR